MKTFFDLVQEVLKPGLCSGCGGCAVFCSGAGYGALEIDNKGKPAYKDMESCIQCGLCYSVCPKVKELDDEIKDRAFWSEPMGPVIETNVIRVVDPELRNRTEDNGVLAALLVHLFDEKYIDGAVITRPSGEFQLRPILVSTREDILASARISHDTCHGDKYAEYPGIEQFHPSTRKNLKRVALVGTPCQINSLRKMQVLNLVPSDVIKFCFGLFCPSGDKEPADHESAGRDSEIFSACGFCGDYSAEFADVSFGKTSGGGDGWTTVLLRTPGGKKILADALRFGRIEQFCIRDNPAFATHALKAVRKASSAKKKTARYNLRNLKSRPVRVNI